jgi:signal transduction histidine kinase
MRQPTGWKPYEVLVIVFNSNTRHVRLSNKMILFNLLSKGVILLVFFFVGPNLLREYALDYTDERLLEKRSQVLAIVNEEGIESFFQDDPEAGYGSYNLLKEEYISLERIVDTLRVDTIFNEERIIEEDIVSYRVLAYTFSAEGSNYLLEIGRSLATIQQIEKVIASLVLVAFFIFIGLTILLDASFHSILLRPFNKIIYKKIPEIQEPNQYTYEPITTQTTDFRILDEAINSLMMRLQQVFNREREFIAHASHELRTPISVMQSKIENMLAETQLNEQEVQRLMDMLQTIQRFKHLVNSLLLISKISNAQYMKEETVDLKAVLTELADEWGPVAREKGLSFIAAESPSMFIANSNYSMVLMMIQNAVINAIRYTPVPGEIRLNALQENNFFVIEVLDTGRGISSDLIEQVKNGLVFLKDANSEKSGFGLQIMNKIATFLNVKLTITSSDKGSTLRFAFTNTSSQ